MKRYVDIIGASPTAKRATDIVAALTPPKPGSPAALVKASGGSTGDSVVGVVKKSVPGIVGGVAGYVMWKRHPVLGFLLGHAVGSNAMKLYKGDRKEAIECIAIEGAGVYAAMKYGKGRTGRSIAAWLGGIVAGTAVAAAIPGTVSRGKYEAWKASR